MTASPSSRVRAGACAALAILAVVGVPLADAAASSLALPPPSIDGATCKTKVAPPPTRDWAAVKGPIDGPIDDLMAAASHYLTFDDADARAVAARLLQAVAEQGGRRVDEAQTRLAALHLETDPRSPAPDVLASLDAALKQRNAKAAALLGRIYERGYLGVAVDPLRASAYYQIAAAAGSTEAYIDFARFRLTDPSLPPAVIEGTRREVLVRVQKDIADGRCEFLLTVGRLFESGRIFPKDLAVAVIWYDAARAAGSIAAAESAAKIYANGRLGRKDAAKAYENFLVAAKAGRVASMYEVAEAKLTGRGTETDPGGARKLLKSLAEADNISALRLLARVHAGEFDGKPDAAARTVVLGRLVSLGEKDLAYLRDYGAAVLAGVGETADRDKAISLLTAAAVRGDRIAARMLALDAEGRAETMTDRQRALGLHRLAARLGDQTSAAVLADAYACGRTVARDPDLARHWADIAAYSDAAAQLYEIADRRLLEGATPEEVFRLQRQVALLGLPRGFAALSRAYEHGVGVAADPTGAAHWLARVEAAPDGEGLLALAGMMATGRFGPQDLDGAEGIYRKVADRGSGRGLYELGTFLADFRGASAQQLRPLFLASHKKGYGAKAIRALVTTLAPGERFGGRTRESWLEAAAETDARAAMLLVADLPIERREAALDALYAGGGVCTGGDVLALAKLYARLATPSAAEKAGRLIVTAERFGLADPSSLGDLGRLLSEGFGGAGRVAEAAPLLERAWANGDLRSGEALAEGYLDGRFVTVDPSRTVDLLIAVAEKGGSKAIARLAELASGRTVQLSGTQTDRIAGLLDREAPRSPAIGGAYGIMAAEGMFGEARRKDGPRLVAAAAEKGDLTAIRWLIRASLTGTHVPRSPKKAAAWMQKAAQMGDPRAMYELGAAYEAGFGVPQDATLSADWRRKATAAGYRP